jgi:hypothetical protein
MTMKERHGAAIYIQWSKSTVPKSICQCSIKELTPEPINSQLHLALVVLKHENNKLLSPAIKPTKVCASTNNFLKFYVR